jgi:hypothetical protein
MTILGLKMMVSMMVALLMALTPYKRRG